MTENIVRVLISKQEYKMDFRVKIKENGMTWDYFIQGYNNWDKETIQKNMKALEGVGSSVEITEIIVSLKDEELSEDLLIKSLKESITFLPNEIRKIKDIISKKTTNFLVKKSDLDGVIYTKEEIFDLLPYIDNDVCTHIVLKSNSLYFDQEMTLLEGRIDENALDLLRHRKRIYEELERLYPDKDLTAICFDEINLLDSEEKKLSANLGLAELKENVRVLEETFERVMKERKEGNYWQTFIDTN